MSPIDALPLPRNDAIALAGGLRMLAADALDAHLGFDGAVDLLFATAGPHALLTTTQPTKAETTP